MGIESNETPTVYAVVEMKKEANSIEKVIERVKLFFSEESAKAHIAMKYDAIRLDIETRKSKEFDADIGSNRNWYNIVEEDDTSWYGYLTDKLTIEK